MVFGDYKTLQLELLSLRRARPSPRQNATHRCGQPRPRLRRLEVINRLSDFRETVFVARSEMNVRVLGKYVKEWRRSKATARLLERGRCPIALTPDEFASFEPIVQYQPHRAERSAGAADDKLCSRCRTLMVVCVDQDCNCRNAHFNFSPSRRHLSCVPDSIDTIP
jgi:hypothetical protein